MKITKSLGILTIVLILFSCSRNKPEEKGFSVSQSIEKEDANNVSGIVKDSISLKTRPSNVLLTGHAEYRLTTVYLQNFDKKTKSYFIGYNNFYSSYSELGSSGGNQWNYNFMPGIEVVYGYNMINISHYNIETQTQKNFFESPVLIKHLYYPAFTNDTLNYKPIKRNYYMVSVYDEDTNKDGYINIKDLRRLYLFDIEGENKKLLVPKNYSVMNSEYDPANDYMYVFARIDKNNNGIRDNNEDIHIFWVDLNDPKKTGRLY